MKDRIKEELAWLRGAFQLAIAALAGLVTFIVQQNPASGMAWIAGGVAVVVLALSVGIVGKVYALFTDLEAL